MTELQKKAEKWIASSARHYDDYYKEDIDKNNKTLIGIGLCLLDISRSLHVLAEDARAREQRRRIGGA